MILLALRGKPGGDRRGVGVLRKTTVSAGAQKQRWAGVEEAGGEWGGGWMESAAKEEGR